MTTDIDKYRRMLIVNRHRLDEELELQAHVLEEIGRRTAMAEAVATSAKDTSAEAEARMTRRLRQDDPRATVDLIKATITLDRECQTLRAREVHARMEADEWHALDKAWYQRGFDLKALGELFVAQYFTINSIGRAEQRPESKTMQTFSRIAQADKAFAETGEAPAQRRRVRE